MLLEEVCREGVVLCETGAVGTYVWCEVGSVGKEVCCDVI